MLKFYQIHLESQLGSSDYIFLQILINVLQAVKKVSIEALANALPIPIMFESLRLKKSNLVERESGIWTELSEIGLREGISIFLEGVKVTQTKNIKSFNLACKWKRKASGFSQKEGWFILTDLTLKLAIERYQQRFDIEEMFRDFKRGGYNLESTKVSGERLISLLLLISLAYLLATIEGTSIKQKGIQKYVGRVKETGRTERRHSCFYIGLYGHTWVNFVGNCGALVEDLLRLAPNKLTCYQRGKRAMQLVMSTF